jgi:hypothetical protein
MGGPVFNESVEGKDNNVPPKGYGVFGHSPSGNGVRGSTGNAVFDPNVNDVGVYGTSKDGPGVVGISNNDDGVFGRSDDNNGVAGTSNTDDGVRGRSDTGFGVFGTSNVSDGVVGAGLTAGVSGIGTLNFSGGPDGDGVRGSSFGGGVGVRGSSSSGDGVAGYSIGSRSSGVFGKNTGSGFGMYAESRDGTGLYCASIGPGGNYAAYLDGKVGIRGPLEKPTGQFKIDHPLDPANKYLSHSFVESPDMKNVYDGVVVLDDKGEAEIELPDWFGALNKDFRYQLTPIGAPAPNLHISEEISSDGVTTISYSNSRSSNNKNKNNSSSRFKVAGGASGMKVSWQVTGIRKDPYANAHRIRVEEDKPAKERGHYLYPELYGQPEEKGISRLLVPEIVRAAAHK